MSRPLHTNEQRPKQVPNYAQAAKAQSTEETRAGPQQPPRQHSVGHDFGHTKNTYHNNGRHRPPANSSWQGYKTQYNKSKDNVYVHRKPSVQLPMAPPADTAPIQFGSINQRPSDTVTKPEFDHHYRPRPPKQEIPRSPRNTNDGRLFTQPYAPRRDYNQGDNSAGGGYNNRYNRNYTRPPLPPPQPPQPSQPPSSSSSSPSPNSYTQYSPQQQQNLPPSPMSHRASPNMNSFTPKKTSVSPHMPQTSPQPIQMTATTAAWAPAGQYFYPHQYPVPVASFNVATTRPPIIPPPTTRKAIAIIDPATGAALNTSPMSLHANTLSVHHPPHKEEKHFDFKVPHVSKPVVIVDPAIRDRELREKKEREEAEAQKKAEEEKARKEQEERLEAERLKQEQERLEAERLEAERREAERLEAERLEAERLESERLEAVRLVAERLEAERKAAELFERKKQEEEMRRKAEEERESRRVISELEAEKKRHEDKKKIKMIQDPSTIQYPPGITPPAVSTEKHVYSIDFLLQFQQICLDTNEEVSAVIMKELLEGSVGPSRNNAVRQSSDRGKGPRTPDMYKMTSRDGRMEMGKFNMGRPLTTRNNSAQYMERQGSMGRGNMMNRGGSRGGGSSGMKIIRNPLQQSNSGPALEPVAPLEKSENRWVPSIGHHTPSSAENELMSQEYITRKVNGLLNKLTLEKFDTIAPQIFDYARQSAKEEDGQSLHTVMQLVFEKACDEPAFANMWARLCSYMYNSMTDDIRDTSLLDENQKPSSGVLLFRKYLFNRCQQEFEKGWKVNMPEVDEIDGVMTDEYYAAVKAKRQGLGLIQFIGELFKMEMLSERIMYSCMTRLCNDPSHAGDEEAESLCKLLTTIGKALDDRPKTAKWVDVVTLRMKNEMINSPKLSSRIKFMIQDLLDLRKDKWVPRIAGNQIGPTTIAKIHEMAEKAKEEKEAAAMKRNNSTRGQYIPHNQYNSNYNTMARSGSYRGNKDFHHNSSDGWSTVAQGTNNKAPRANELSNFGKLDRSRPRNNILGPANSPFATLSRVKSTTNVDTKNTSDGRSSPATNMFSALVNGSDERKKLQLASRTVSDNTPKLSDEAVKRKSKNILEEYFNIRDKKELVECVKELDDPSYLVIFVNEMLTVVEKKAQDVEDMTDVMKHLNSENLLTKETYIKAFKSFMEGYDDLTIDVPQAPKYVAQLLAAGSVTPEEVGGEEHDSLQSAYQAVMSA